MVMVSLFTQGFYFQMGHSSKGKHVYIDFFPPPMEDAVVVVISVSEIVCVQRSVTNSCEDYRYVAAEDKGKAEMLTDLNFLYSD